MLKSIYGSWGLSTTIHNMTLHLTRRRFGGRELRYLVLWLGVLTALPLIVGRSGAEGADTIYFKDGMRTVCGGKAWEKNDEVHCEYDGGLLIYSKADVARIEKGPAVEPEPAPPKDPAPETAAPRPAAPAPAAASTAVSSPAPQPSEGMLFYDPRRPQKYWSSATRHHDTFRDAVSALAEEFNRPSHWIEENMGESNELNTVRENLAARLSEAATGSPDADPPPAGGHEFYNPRRSQKYMTGSDARHNTFKEAVEALAREFLKPAEWVERHMGESNDVDQIRQNLKDAQHAEMAR
jgi:hypothetical protein